ncbi:ribonuclease H protein, partial [Trifolium medium]|nr:ribonuclease H protein [Trifolium medium]
MFSCSEWAYLRNAQDVGEAMRQQFMFFEIISTQLRYVLASWKTTFMTTCWFLWTWRNKAIFEDDFEQPNNPILVINNFTRGMKLCSIQLLHQNIQQKEMIYIGWNKPPESWIKLNSDGACKGSGKSSDRCGLFQNSDGRWIKGYIRKIGACDSLQAEMLDLYLGFEMAWRERIPQ